MKLVFSDADSEALQAIMEPVFIEEQRERKQTRVFLVILILALLTIAIEIAYIWRVELMEWITLGHHTFKIIVQLTERLL